MDVGYAGLVWPVNAPCIAGIPNIHVGQNIDRPAYATTPSSAPFPQVINPAGKGMNESNVNHAL
jgi:hypothetical protein